MKKTIPNRLKEMLDEKPDRELFVFYDHEMTKRTMDVGELYSLATRFSSVLRDAGLVRGDVLFCSLPLCPELVVVNYGVLMAGGIVLNYEMTSVNSDIFYHCLNKAKCKFLAFRTTPDDLAWNELRCNVQGHMDANHSAAYESPKHPTVTTSFLITRGDDGGDDPGFLDKIGNLTETYINEHVAETDVAALFLTSGTTGMPKMSMRSHISLIEDGDIGGGLLPTKVKSIRRKLILSPWSWSIATHTDTLSGETRVQPDLWHKPQDYHKLLADIVLHDPLDSMFLTPPDLEGIAKNWHSKNKKFADVIISGGFPFNQQLINLFLEYTDKLIVRYGSSEVLLSTYNILTDASQFQDFDCGELNPGTVVKAVNENLEEVPYGTPGRLLLRNPGMFSGYYNDPEKTAEVLTDDGWFLSNDAGFVNDEGHLMILGRHDYVIKHNDTQIYPAYLEKIIRPHPAVKDVVVIPIPDEINYHNICACIVRHPGESVTESEVKELVTDKYTADNEVPVEIHHVIFVDKIEMSNRGKINRNKLIDDAISFIQRTGR